MITLVRLFCRMSFQMFAVKETAQKDAKSHWLHVSLILNTNGPLVSSDCHHHPPPLTPLHKDEAQLEGIAKGEPMFLVIIKIIKIIIILILLLFTRTKPNWKG